MKDITCFVCCQLVIWHFAARVLFFFCLIPFLFLEVQVTGVKNSRHKSDSVHKFPVYKPTKKCLWLCMSHGLIFGVLRYLFFKKNQLQHTTHQDNYFKFTFFCEINQPLSIFIGKSTKFEFCDMNLTTLKVEPRSNDET